MTISSTEVKNTKVKFREHSEHTNTATTAATSTKIAIIATIIATEAKSRS